jgi:hypothetical protein
VIGERVIGERVIGEPLIGEPRCPIQANQEIQSKKEEAQRN